MIRIPLPSTDWSLLLNPRWGEMPGPAQAGLLLVLAAVPALLVIWLYRYEMRLVSGRVAAGLLALRLLVLLVILFLLGLQPVLARTVTEDLPGQVLVAVDRSDSMDVADPQRPSADKLRLARALRLAGDLCADAQLDEWIRQYEAGKDGPRWVAPDEAAGEPERRRQLAEQRRRVHDQVCERVDALTRSRVARQVLAEDGGALLPRIVGRHKVELLGFAQETWDVQAGRADELFQQLRGGPAPGKDDGRPAEDPGTFSLPPPSAFTDLRQPLTRALERSGPDQGRVLGLVLLTDGQHNWGSSPVAKALELGEHRLPVYPVALGARQAPPDVAVVAVKAPAAVFKDVDAPVEARVKVSGLPGEEIVVELRTPDADAGQPPLQERIHHDGGDRYYTVRFQPRMEKVGTQALTVAARPVNGESRTDNNSRALKINVADDRARVLVIDGEARWEYHYLASALQRDRTVQLETVVFAQPRVGKVAEEELRKAGNPGLALPEGPDALSAYDCIVLGDATPAQLPAADRLRLEKYVTDAGGTLVLLAGKRALPLAFTQGQAVGAEDDPLARLLPVEQPRVVQPAAGFAVSLGHEGKLTPFLQMDAEAGESEAIWAGLPRHYWGVVGRAKPGATALALLGGGPAAEAGDGPARERENALIVRQHYGFGRVLFIGLDSTWRWRYRVGDLYHHRFWGQVVRWAAADKPLVSGNDAVRFGVREPVYRQGQEVELVVRLGDGVGPLPGDALAGARILRQGGAGEEAVALAPLEVRAAQPRVLEGRLRDLPPGQYHVELAIPALAGKLDGPPRADGRPAPLRATFTVIPGDGGEMVELATNWPLLEELAAKSGGRVFTAENAAELVDLLVRQGVTREEHLESRLWQWWGVLVLLLLLLTVEWVVRKWAGLP